jgi:sialidase-1
VQSRTDHGKTWGEARDITDEIAKPEWKMDFKFITSGRGIQTRDGELLHTMVNLKNGLHIFGSKDHGKSWYLKDVPIKPGNESKVIELADGRLMVNCRSNGKGYRWVHVSDDRGTSWEGHKETSLVDPGCNGSILRYTSVDDGYKKNRLIFSNANSAKGRKNLAVRISYDEGKTWSDGKVITTGKAMYSDLTICPDGSIGILWEPGDGVRFTSITLEDLTDGKDKLSKPYKVPGAEK